MLAEKDFFSHALWSRGNREMETLRLLLLLMMFDCFLAAVVVQRTIVVMR